EKEKIKPKYPDMNAIRKELSLKYEIEEVQKDDHGLSSIDRSQLQHTGIYSIGWFKDSCSLVKLIKRLRLRHAKNDDQMDEWDLEQIQINFTKRWKSLCYSEGGKAAVRNHYLKEEPFYEDSTYITMAKLMAHHYQKQGISVFVYDLLM